MAVDKNKILVIDDSLPSLNNIKEILDGKYDVEMAQSLEVGLRLIEKKLPDVILMDMDMPNETGVECIEQIYSNEAYEDIPAILMLGVEGRGFSGSKAFDYILKSDIDVHLEKKVSGALVAALSKKKANDRIADVSHEIRNIMCGIIPNLELALGKDMTEDVRENLKDAEKCSESLLELVNTLMDYSKIESGKMEVNITHFNINNCIENCRAIFSARAIQKKLNLNFDTDSLNKINSCLMGDPANLKKIFNNLLSNAIKLTNAGGNVSFCVAIEEFTENVCKLKFEVADTGIGMKPEQLADIFKAYAQVADTARKHGGTGLGLYITNSLVEAMGGKLEVQSEYGVGSTFSFRLAFLVGLENIGMTDNAGEEGAEIEKPSFGGEEILVVDDNSMNLRVACEHFKLVGLAPFAVLNGMEAVATVKERLQDGIKPFDLIFMDVHMPTMDGMEAAIKIKALDVKTPIIAMTADTMNPSNEAPYKAFGMEGYLCKPYTAQDLWKCLLKYLKPAKA